MCTFDLTHNARPASARKPLRTGFSLFELFLTLAILVTIAGLVVPTLESHIWQTEKENSLTQTRLSLLKARQAAIDSGRPTSWYSQAHTNSPIGSHLIMQPSVITFLPDGTTQDARITIVHSDVEVGTLRVIGATGTINLDSEMNL